MAKTVIIRLTCSGNRTGPFDITDNLGTVLGTDITKQNLIDGYTVSVGDSVTKIIITSVGKCPYSFRCYYWYCHYRTTCCITLYRM